jgi:hypothetical protein
MLQVCFPNVSAVSSIYCMFLPRCCICSIGYTHMLQVYILNVSPISYRCCKCFSWMMLYVVVVIHICCKRMFSLFHPISVCCSKCCSPRALARGLAHTARTHQALSISVMSNSRTCTQRAVSAQMAEHSLVKVHARMLSARVGQHPTDAESGPLYHQPWSPTVEHAAGPPRWSVQPGSTRVRALCSHPLSRM